MPNQRAPGQKLVNVQMSGDFIRQINAAFPIMGYSDRAKFIRDAVYEKLEREGIKVPRWMVAAPSRAGKGGEPSHRDFRSRHQSSQFDYSPAILNEPKPIAKTSSHSPASAPDPKPRQNSPNPAPK